MRTARALPLALTGTAVALAALTACAGSSSPGSRAHTGQPTAATSAAPPSHPAPRPASAVAALKQVQARLAQVHSVREDSSDASGALSWREKGVSDWSHGTVDDTVVTFTDSVEKAVLQQFGVSHSLETRSVAGTSYVRIGPQEAAKNGGRTWARSAGGVGALAMLQTVPQQGDAGPAGIVSKLLAVPGVHSVGTETVSGVRAVHYTGTLTAKPPTRDADGKRVMAPDTLHQDMQAANLTREKLDVWVSVEGPDKGLPVQESLYGTAPHHSSDTVSILAHYSGFGLKVHVVAPPAKDCVDAFALR
ncbi:hypothetical protein AB0399_04335 [Streptomyces sp. NPDC088194]|uniref:hypothetical protein n=1 Tax=Streptomyces sp. NPDC088194 TaxID=3154931 RepID=UPI00344D6BED